MRVCIGIWMTVGFGGLIRCKWSRLSCTMIPNNPNQWERERDASDDVVRKLWCSLLLCLYTRGARHCKLTLSLYLGGTIPTYLNFTCEILVRGTLRKVDPILDGWYRV